jgi:hypothetical protein
VRDHVVTIFTGSQAQLYIGRVQHRSSCLGLSGASTYVSCPRAYISERRFWPDDMDATDRDELYSHQSGCVRAVIEERCTGAGDENRTRMTSLEGRGHGAYCAIQRAECARESPGMTVLSRD